MQADTEAPELTVCPMPTSVEANVADDLTGRERVVMSFGDGQALRTVPPVDLRPPGQTLLVRRQACGEIRPPPATVIVQIKLLVPSP